MSSPDWGLNPGPLDYMSIAIPLSYLDYTLSSITQTIHAAQLYVLLYMIHKLYIGFYPNFVLVFKIWVLDSCPIGPGLSKIIERSSILFRQD